jgi:hypothetical protein
MDDKKNHLQLILFSWIAVKFYWKFLLHGVTSENSILYRPVDCIIYTGMNPTTPLLTPIYGSWLSNMVPKQERQSWNTRILILEFLVGRLLDSHNISPHYFSRKIGLDKTLLVRLPIPLFILIYHERLTTYIIKTLDHEYSTFAAATTTPTTTK